MPRLLKLLVIAAAALACPTAACAQDGGGWDFRIEPYLIVPSMDGDITLRGRTAEAGVSPVDIFGELNFGFQGYFEARTDAWGLGLDVIYMNLDASDDDRLAEIDVHQGAYTPTVFARVAPGLDAYAGVRINTMGGDLDFQGPLGLDTVERDKTWVDPLLGLRYQAPLGDKWNFSVSGDVAGVVTGSDIAVNVWPMFGYELSDGAQVTLGYRFMYTDYDSGSGADLFEYDMVTSGPVLGAQFDF